MKKIIKLAVVMSLMVVVAGCSSEKSEDDIVTITIGTSPDYPPFESYAEDGETIIGFDPDVVEGIEAIMNEGDTQYDLVLTPMSFDNIITQLNAGQVDLGMSGFTYSEDRKVEWSTPYAYTSQVAVVNPDSGITGVADLEGKTIGVQTSSTGEAAAKDISGAELVSLADVNTLFEGLKANQYDAVIVDYAVAQNYATKANYKVVDEAILDEENFIIAKEGNTEVLDKVNAAIEEYVQTEEYAKVAEEYGIKKID